MLMQVSLPAAQASHQCLIPEMGAAAQAWGDWMEKSIEETGEGEEDEVHCVVDRSQSLLDRWHAAPRIILVVLQQCLRSVARRTSTHSRELAAALHFNAQH